MVEEERVGYKDVMEMKTNNITLSLILVPKL
jgi:hypothetical protein